MSIGGSSYFHQVYESEAERGSRKLPRLDLDLNYPPTSDNATLAALSGVQSSAAPDDECLVISPRKNEEAMTNSQRNPSRRVRNNEDVTQADLMTLGISLGQLQTANRMISLIHKALNKTKDTAFVLI